MLDMHTKVVKDEIAIFVVETQMIIGLLMLSYENS